MNSLVSRIDKVREEEGVWRAKEILSSYIASVPYDEALYLMYGELLYELGDKLESGKYFLLTSTKNPLYHDAIALFLKRHRGNYFSHFPRAFKRTSKKNYPQNLLEEMKKNPVLKKDVKRHSKVPAYDVIDNKYIGLLSLSIMIGSMLVGFVVIVRYLWSLF